MPTSRCAIFGSVGVQCAEYLALPYLMLTDAPSRRRGANSALLALSVMSNVLFPHHLVGILPVLSMTGGLLLF